MVDAGDITADEPEATAPPWWPRLEELLESLRPRLGRIVHRYRIPPGDAEDLIQETLLILCSKRGRVRNPEAWIAGTLRNRCLLYWRARRSTKENLRWVVSSELVATLTEARDVEAHLGKRLDPRDPGLRHDLSRALAQIPAPWAEVVRLRIVAGCNVDETARGSGYRASGIRKILGRAYRRLRAFLDSSGGTRFPT